MFLARDMPVEIYGRGGGGAMVIFGNKSLPPILKKTSSLFNNKKILSTSNGQFFESPVVIWSQLLGLDLGPYSDLFH